ncbi:MAG: ubiquinol-cytochrome c reductase iron-sulfur subunit [Hyphomicrobiales bacterium]|nr:ubiquinol-cytochrome c reductase iron-sulfur subunit [Hyphomicrobiales bacterium]
MTTLVSQRSAVSRRRLLYVTTAAFAGAGALVAAWPFFDQMNPDATLRSVGDTVGVDLAALRPGERRAISWHNVPIFVVRRTAEMLAAMQDKTFVDRLVDPDSERLQQPASMKNWHRSIDPAYAVLVGVCTYCRCVPEYQTEAGLGMAGGTICPCCASRYDPAGRAYSGIAQYNLPVPPYVIERPARLLVGKNMPGETFRLEAVERL